MYELRYVRYVSVVIIISTLNGDAGMHNVITNNIVARFAGGWRSPLFGRLEGEGLIPY